MHHPVDVLHRFIKPMQLSSKGEKMDNLRPDKTLGHTLETHVSDVEKPNLFNVLNNHVGPLVTEFLERVRQIISLGLASDRSSNVEATF